MLLLRQQHTLIHSSSKIVYVAVRELEEIKKKRITDSRRKKNSKFEILQDHTAAMQLSRSQYGLNRQVTGMFLARILPTMFSKRGFCHYAEIPWSFPANDKKSS